MKFHFTVKKGWALVLASTILVLPSCSRQEGVFVESVQAEGITCEVSVFSPEIIRVVKYPSGTVGASGKLTRNRPG